MINGGLKEVVGVTLPEFFSLAVGDSFDIVVLFCQPKELRRDVFDVTVMGRLRPARSRCIGRTEIRDSDLRATSPS
jgi:hypothetical protein